LGSTLLQGLLLGLDHRVALFRVGYDVTIFEAVTVQEFIFDLVPNNKANVV
jgi:hypothetical protein